MTQKAPKAQLTFTYAQQSSQIDYSPSGNELSLLALDSIPGIGFATVRTLFEAYKWDLSQVWTASNEELHRHLKTARTPHPQQVIRRILSDQKNLLATAKQQYLFLKIRRQISILIRGSELYPKKLEDLPYPPAWLFVEGNVKLLNDPMIVAVVGTRTPTEQGLEAARRLSVSLVRNGCLILSGLAEGIDETGHRTSVDYGAPTIAVLGHGIDVTFPAATAGLRREMITLGGAVVSEYLPRDTYSSERFVQRNRIQAALSQAVAVVEGRTKSGTAHTVRFARKLNRILFGARLGELRSIPNQELLDELEKAGDSVFDLDRPQGREGVRKFLENLFTLELCAQRQGDPRLFRGLLSEIHRLARDYDASEDDFEWLINQIRISRSSEENIHADKGSNC
jgi:DNA protecting protein DprA